MRYAPSSRIALILVLVVLVLFLPPAPGGAQVPEEPVLPAHAPGEVIVGWQPGQGPVPAVPVAPDRMGTDREDVAWQAAAATIVRETGLTLLDADPEHGTARLAVRAGSEAVEIERLETLPWVRYAEHNYYAYATDASTGATLYPNDTDFARQWNMHRVKAPEAWFLTRGSLSFVVAVLDTGVASGHPEFAGRLLDGFNYVANRPGAEDDDPESHGTHVSGILVANMNNGQGVAGLAPDIRLLPFKVLNSNRTGRYDAIAAAVYDAADMRAQVINMSLAGLAQSQLLQDAVSYAQAKGSLIVAAAGNCAQNPANCEGQINPIVYPAAYPGVLAVSSSDRFDRATIYSGYKGYVGLAAPGGTAEEPVWSTTRWGYGSMYGTSMSTPLVSAAAALVWTFRPAATAAQVSDILKFTADRVGTDPYSGLPLSYANGRNDYFGTGRLNVENAVRWAYPPSLAAGSDHVSILLGGATTSATRSIEITNPSRQHVYWQATVLSGAPWLTLATPAGTSVYGYAAPLTVQLNKGSLPPNTYSGVIRVQPVDPAGLAPVDLRVDLRVAATLSPTYLPAITQGVESAWLDPDSPGSLYRNILAPANDSFVTLALPFPVDFYGAAQQVIQVSDNGFVVFGAPNGATGRVPAECPGTALPPNNAVYVLASDWNPAWGGQVIVHRPDASTYVVTWRDVRSTSGGLPQSFQLVITSSGSFQANYRTIASPLPGMIGAENYDGAFAHLVFCNGTGRQVRSGESLRFAARLPW